MQVQSLIKPEAAVFSWSAGFRRWGAGLTFLAAVFAPENHIHPSCCRAPATTSCEAGSTPAVNEPNIPMFKANLQHPATA